MINTWKKLLIVIAVMALGLFLFLSWYKYHYSMGVAESFEVNAPDLDKRVLIATQRSEFKNAVVAAVVQRLRQRPIYIKVIDVSLLPGMDEADWNAVVVLHTWEYGEPQFDARDFLLREKVPDKVVVLTTSGAGDQKIEGVDAITTASVMTQVSANADAITARLEPLLR